ncbi:MAG: hypothetical protein IPK00_14790 [Deltaproteobacteria bacterium]|nr:hypothetical protein [Deltaproteobacteria bacterium]
MTRAARVANRTALPTLSLQTLSLPTPSRPTQAPLRLEQPEARLRLVEPDPGEPERGHLRWTDLQEGTREVVVTLLATIAFGLGWAAVEAGQANSALARKGIPAMQAMASSEAAFQSQTGYPRPPMERR